MSEPGTHETDAHETARPRASTQTLVAGILAALGALMVITGSVLPWVSGTGWIYGRAQSSDTVTLGLRQGGTSVRALLLAVAVLAVVDGRRCAHDS